MVYRVALHRLNKEDPNGVIAPSDEAQTKSSTILSSNVTGLVKVKNESNPDDVLLNPSSLVEEHAMVRSDNRVL